NSAEDYSSNPKQAKIPKFQDIPPEDRIRRLEFCDNMLKKMDMVKDLATNILFTGEHIFTAVGHQTPAEIRCWIKKNIQMSEPTVPQSSEKIVVWILQGVIIPTIKSLDINIKDVWLQHDGLPVHNAKSLKSFLKACRRVVIKRFGKLVLILACYNPPCQTLDALDIRRSTNRADRAIVSGNQNSKYYTWHSKIDDQKPAQEMQFTCKHKGNYHDPKRGSDNDGKLAVQTPVSLPIIDRQE
ncbi:hypothetical protein QE152_g37995, partial [Popillia japonica]